MKIVSREIFAFESSPWYNYFPRLWLSIKKHAWISAFFLPFETRLTCRSLSLSSSLSLSLSRGKERCSTISELRVELVDDPLIPARGSSGTGTFEIGRLFDGRFQPRSLICRVIKKKEEEREKERGGREGEKKGEKNSRVIELRCLIGLMRRWTRNDGSNPLFEEVEPVRKIH